MERTQDPKTGEVRQIEKRDPQTGKIVYKWHAYVTGNDLFAATLPSGLKVEKNAPPEPAIPDAGSNERQVARHPQRCPGTKHTHLQCEQHGSQCEVAKQVQAYESQQLDAWARKSLLITNSQHLYGKNLRFFEFAYVKLANYATFLCILR